MMMPRFPKLRHAGVMAGVASLVITMTSPVNAAAAADLYRSDAGDTVTAPASKSWVRIVRSSQQLTVGDVTSTDTGRDNYGITTPPPKPTATPTATATGTPSAKTASPSTTTDTTRLQVLVTGAGEDGKKYQYNAASNGPIGWPFPDGAPISSSFGARQVANCSYCSTFHDGIDFAPGYGTPIHAIAAGKVTVAGAYYGYGEAVVVESNVDGLQFETVYGHIAVGTIDVKVGDTVTFGQTFAEVGSTGNSTGPHLHLGITVEGEWVDPLLWLHEHAGTP
jgi:murein DD-endopeptidase MepM/ murein hydrolase activator NlpD